MRGIGPLTLLIGVSLALVIGTSTGIYAQTTTLRGARVIDGRGGAPIDDAVIVMRDGRVAAIGPSAATAVPPDAQVVDYTGKTVISGLISNHSHIGIFIGLKAAPENYNRDASLRQLRQLEAYGVTTVMALGLNGPLLYELRPKLHAGRVPGADLFGADKGLGVPGAFSPIGTAVADGWPFGSDSGVGLRIPGVAEHLELALMVDAGLTPMQALNNATSNAAALLKLDDRGVLAPGKLADLVVLDADPSTDISKSRKIHAVWTDCDVHAVSNGAD